MTVLVFGSLNIDLVTQVSRLPNPGETLLGDRFTTVPGGKGANQAVAAAGLGVKTAMVGRVGADSFGQTVIHSLNTAGVDTSKIQVDRGASTGIAAIAVAASGENQIIVVPGANGSVDGSDVNRLPLTEIDILLMQFEIPVSAVEQAALQAKTHGVTVIIDPAPAIANLSDALYRSIDILTPNQTEAACLTNCPVDSPEDGLKAASVLRSRGVDTVIVKLGAQGCLCSSPDATFFLPAYSVKAVDTVAAGDAFNGGLAAALGEGKNLIDAVIQGSATAALSVTQSGAQDSLPERDRVRAFMTERPTPKPIEVFPD
ncbi:MAG: ribokinase [Cyanobacteria bacterium P01_D01_bin.128]